MKSVQIRSFSGPYFPYSVQMQENTDQKKLVIWTLFTQCAIHETNWKCGMCLVDNTVNIVCPYNKHLPNKIVHCLYPKPM